MLILGRGGVLARVKREGVTTLITHRTRICRLQCARFHVVTSRREITGFSVVLTAPQITRFRGVRCIRQITVSGFSLGLLIDQSTSTNTIDTIGCNIGVRSTLMQRCISRDGTGVGRSLLMRHCALIGRVLIGCDGTIFSTSEVTSLSG